MDTAGEIYETRRLHGHNEPPMERDDLSSMLERDWDELFAMPAADLAAFQLAAARRRFEEMRPRLRALDAQASSAGVTRIDRIEDVVPLLFLDAVYKSYPLALVEKGRFDLLTQWLQAYTTIDLSAVVVSDVVSIDTWLDALADQTPLRVIHTTGTSGKLSYFPRSTLEIELWSESFVKMLEGFGGERGFRLGKRGERLPVIVPIPRHAKYIGQRNLDYLQTHVAPSPDQLYVLNNGTLSADLLSLAGRIRIAQAKGDLSQVKLTEPMRLAMRNYLEELERRPAEQGEFFRRVVDELGGQRVFISSAGNILLQAAKAGAARGLSRVFSAESAGITGPGGKEPLPTDWLDQITDFTGLSTWRMVYGMSELVGLMPGCSYGHYHIPPYYIPFLLDPESGALLPRTGTVTGRFAFLDLLPQTNWGGVISGDKVTLTFDAPCRCGRSGAYVHPDISRYSAAVTGEDKITCAATVDNTDLALQQLLGL